MDREQVAFLAEGWQWMPGMSVRVCDTKGRLREGTGGILLWEVEAGTTGYIAGFAKHFEARVQRSEDFALAATDPATIGCLQALARQAWKSPKASAFYSPITGAWMFMPKRNKSIKGASEADVLLAAIIAGSESIQPTTGKGFNICDDESYLRDEGVVLGSEARKRWDE